MPQAPTLSPEQMAKVGQGSAIDPQNFLLAAADLHQSGALSSPMPTGQPLGGPAKSGKGRKTMKVVK